MILIILTTLLLVLRHKMGFEFPSISTLYSLRHSIISRILFVLCLIGFFLGAYFLLRGSGQGEQCPLDSNLSTENCHLFGKTSLSPHTSLNYQIGTPKGGVSYSVNVTRCSLDLNYTSDDMTKKENCTISVLVLDQDQINEFNVSSDDIPEDIAILPTQRINTRKAILELTFMHHGDGAQQNYTMVVANQNEHTVYFSYQFHYTPFESCLGVILGVEAVLIVPVLIGIFLYCRTIDFEKRIYWPYVKPEPIEFIARYGWRIHLLDEQTFGFGYYWLQCDDVFWIWFPERIEVLPKSQRVIIACTFLVLGMLLQTVWANANQAINNEFVWVEDKVPFLGPLIGKVIAASIIISVVSVTYRPIMRLVYKGSTMGDAEDSPQWKKWTSLVLRYSSIIVFSLLLSYSIYTFTDLFDDYTCLDFSTEVFIPFMATLLAKSFFPGIISRYICYRVENTFGKPAPLMLDDIGHDEESLSLTLRSGYEEMPDAFPDRTEEEMF
eukprot:TRINITY_DN12696_c0_g1_i1.p1 TRINITY_DN12696_c0_g1~~TRINITY_DN12696_c0_g1_i1.p1  ORF type:complete len:495 (-),score=103.16 TRINITY_DN12696_c0_g1_i1:61-1545(-)